MRNIIFTIKILINMAFIVGSLQVVNQALVNSAQPREQFFGIQVNSVGQVMIFAGGIPLQCHNSTLGLIRISCGHPPSRRRSVSVLLNFLSKYRIGITIRYSLSERRQTTYSDLDCQQRRAADRWKRLAMAWLSLPSLCLLLKFKQHERV